MVWSEDRWPESPSFCSNEKPRLFPQNHTEDGLFGASFHNRRIREASGYMVWLRCFVWFGQNHTKSILPLTHRDGASLYTSCVGFVSGLSPSGLIGFSICGPEQSD